FKADQRHGDADRADDDRGDHDVDVVGAQGEADREVVDAQREPVTDSRRVRWDAPAAALCCCLAWARRGRSTAEPPVAISSPARNAAVRTGPSYLGVASVKGVADQGS